MILHKENFENYAIKHLGMSSNTLNSYEKEMNKIVGVTPYIVEESEMRFNLLSIYDRMMKDRILWFNGVVEDEKCNIVNAQLMYLDSVSNKDINMNINSPGGSCYAGLSLISSIELCKSKIFTTVNGIAASMGSVLLGSGVKGERTATRFSRVMLHQASSSQGYQNIQESRISMKEFERINDELFILLGEYCDKDPDTIKKDTNRDLWLGAYEALEYGIIDKVLERNGKIVTRDNIKEFKK